MRRLLLNLLHRWNWLSITPWLQRSLLSFSFNHTASYSSTRTSTDQIYDEETRLVFHKSVSLGNHLLLDENRWFHPCPSKWCSASGGSTRHQLLTFFNADSVASLLSDVVLADGDQVAGTRMRCSTAIWLDESLALKPSLLNRFSALNHVDFHTKISFINYINLNFIRLSIPYNLCRVVMWGKELIGRWKMRLVASLKILLVRALCETCLYKCTLLQRIMG